MSKELEEVLVSGWVSINPPPPFGDRLYDMTFRRGFGDNRGATLIVIRAHSLDEAAKLMHEMLVEHGWLK